MNIKVGDKVRIKTKEELLADGWEPIYSTRNSIVWYSKLGCNVCPSQCGIIIKVTDIEGNYVFYGLGSICTDAIAEVIYYSLDEYICSLTLEERAKQFILTVPYIRPYTIEEVFYSTITVAKYNSYEEALIATIYALRGEKK